MAHVIDIKVTGTFLMSKAVATVLIEQGQGGRIVNLSSVAGKRGSADAPVYSTANFAVQGFTEVLAKWLAPHQVSCNAVCPGITDTARMDDLGYPRDERWDRLTKSIPLKRVATDDEIAGVIAFLCTPSAEYITGQSISVDGGVTMG